MYILCNFCCIKFNRKKKLMQQIKSMHLKIKTFCCILCWQHFSKKSNVNKHFRKVLKNVKKSMSHLFQFLLQTLCFTTTCQLYP